MLNLRPSSRPWRTSAVALALALGVALAGCGPSKQFCKDAMDNGYVCEKISDAAPPVSEVYDGPEEERGVTVVGDDETAMGDAAGDAPAADAPAADAPAGDAPADAGATAD